MDLDEMIVELDLRVDALDSQRAHLIVARDALRAAIAGEPVDDVAAAKVAPKAGQGGRRPRPSGEAAASTAHPVRSKILRLLANGATAGARDLALAMKVEQSSLAFHLSAMKTSGQLQTKGKSRATVYLLT